MKFTRQHLEGDGFSGWIPFGEVCASACPPTGGVYVVTYGRACPPTFSAKSCGGWFKGKNPAVTPEVLSANWVDEAEVVYIGKADQLMRRLGSSRTLGRARR